MKLPISWISEYVNIRNFDNLSYASAMTMSGSAVAAIEDKESGLKNVVTGRILKIEQHPNADKLSVCQVDLRDERVQIVTGATNIFEGAVVPVAKHRSVIANNVKITKGRLRGIESFGMMCSASELGQPGDNSGIMIMPEGTNIGLDINTVLNLNDKIIEFEITYNRPDCSNIIGIARETAATFGRKLEFPQVNFKEANQSIHDIINLDNANLCKRFCMRGLRNVKIAPSPVWMQARLNVCGIRPVNNIVDVTNYVMIEYGQPLHAYDFDKIEGNKLTIRTSQPGEEFQALDGQVKRLSGDMVVVSDSSKILSLAGIIGGAGSQISGETGVVLLESAVFDSDNIKRTASMLGFNTEAAARFGRAVNLELSGKALERACQLLYDIQAGEILEGMIDIQSERPIPVKIPFDPQKINQILGLDLKTEEMLEILSLLNFRCEDGKLVAPSFRSDIHIIEDIAEEVARFYGYNNIDVALPSGTILCGGKRREQNLEDLTKQVLVYSGLFEIKTYSFANPSWASKLLMGDEFPNAVVLSNPLGYENSIMRTTMLGSMLEALRNNYNQRNESVSLFEVGNIYTKSDVAHKAPSESRRLMIGSYDAFDFYELKRIITELFDRIGIGSFMVRPCEQVFAHPGRCASIMMDTPVIRTEIGVFGQVHPQVASNFELPVHLYFAQINLEAAFKFCTCQKKYTPLPKFPSISRDISFIIEEEIDVYRIEEIIDKIKADAKIIEAYELFDIYKGKQVGDNKKSVAYSFTFRSQSGTLKDEQADAVINTILSALKLNLNAQVR